jgi:hypothetical protein
MTGRASGFFRHGSAGVLFAALALVWSFPLVRHLTTHLPGPGIGDNVDFLWNFWWARWALASGSPLFHTTYLFVPVGADLTLHTHTALAAVFGATALGGLPIIAAENVTILLGLFLNGFGAYWLSWRITRDRGSAIVGGIVFGGSPFIAAHLYGHFNFTMAWTIPLFAVAASEAVRGGTIRWAVAAGSLLGITAYIDYYYLVYELVLALCFVGLEGRDWAVTRRGPTPRSRILARWTAILILADVVVLTAIVVTGGFAVDWGPVRLSARDVFNPLQAFWLLVAAFLCFRFRPHVAGRRCHGTTTERVLRGALIASAVFLLTAAPIVWGSLGLFWRGEYVTPQYFWRSAPKGIDLASFILGNPLNGLWGATVRGAYRSGAIDLVESTGWLGVVPMLLAGWAVWRRIDARAIPPCPASEGSPPPHNPPPHDATSRAVSQWSTIGLVFLVWALGPHLTVFGMSTGMPLPQALLRYVPVVANARIPGRAMIMTYLALSVLSAIGISKRHQTRTPVLILMLAVLAIVADFLPAPFPLVALDHPSIYEVLRDRREPGAVCELPLGIRDGLGDRGAFDDRVLFYQTIHQRRLAGGFVARLPQAVIATYEGDPLLAALLRLSQRAAPSRDAPPLPDRVAAADRLRLNGIAFIVLNRAAASAELIDYVEHVLPLTLIAQADTRSLYLFSK